MRTRQLRSRTTNPRNGNKRRLLFDGLPEPAKGRPAKRQKTEEQYLCIVCVVKKPSCDLPDRNPSSSSCKHLINTCTECLQKWLTSQIEDGMFIPDEKDDTVFGLRCLECLATMTTADIEAVATPEIYELFRARVSNHIASARAKWFWCQNPRCQEGRILEDPEATVFTCQMCSFVSCVPCERPYHLGEACEEYRTRVQGHIHEEDESLKWCRKSAQRCPHCLAFTEKTGGCNSMFCGYLRESCRPLLTNQARNVLTPGGGPNSDENARMFLYHSKSYGTAAQASITMLNHVENDARATLRETIR